MSRTFSSRISLSEPYPTTATLQRSPHIHSRSTPKCPRCKVPLFTSSIRVLLLVWSPPSDTVADCSIHSCHSATIIHTHSTPVLVEFFTHDVLFVAKSWTMQCSPKLIWKRSMAISKGFAICKFWMEVTAIDMALRVECLVSLSLSLSRRVNDLALN